MKILKELSTMFDDTKKRRDALEFINLYFVNTYVHFHYLLVVFAVLVFYSTPWNFVSFLTQRNVC